jgi:hypothetical protein
LYTRRLLSRRKLQSSIYTMQALLKNVVYDIILSTFEGEFDQFLDKTVLKKI